MAPATSEPDRRRRSLLFFASPALWPGWPFLPVVRRAAGRHDELGVMFDLLHVCGLPGYSATVFLTNLFELPEDLEGLLALPREVFDTPEEVLAAGWSVD